MYILKLDYFSLMNFIELSGNALAFTHYFYAENKWLEIIMAICIYIKMLFALNVFKKFRSLISLIFKCIEDISYFFFLVILMLVTFAVLNYVILV